MNESAAHDLSPVSMQEVLESVAVGLVAHATIMQEFVKSQSMSYNRLTLLLRVDNTSDNGKGKERVGYIDNPAATMTSRLAVLILEQVIFRV